jgi:hypothetical protein
MRSGALLLWAACALCACAAAPPVAAPNAAATAADRQLLAGIERYIDSLADTPKQKSALMQLVSALDATLTVDLRVPSSIKRAALDVAEAVNCVWTVYDELGAHRVEAIRRLVLQGTPARREASERYERVRAGAVVAMPSQDTCR